MERIECHIRSRPGPSSSPVLRRRNADTNLLSGLMVFSWFCIVHIPRTFLGVSDSIAVFEALAVFGIAFVLAG